MDPLLHDLTPASLPKVLPQLPHLLIRTLLTFPIMILIQAATRHLNCSIALILGPAPGEDTLLFNPHHQGMLPLFYPSLGKNGALQPLTHLSLIPLPPPHPPL